MDSGRHFFDSSWQGNMFLLRDGHDNVFRGGRSVMNMDETSKRRPFFSSPDELFDEEYYDEQSPEKKRRLTPDQVHMLENSFETDNKLEPERKTQLAKKVGLQPRQVAVWFQNRRARCKTKQLERDYDQLKSSYESLLSNHDSIFNDNQKLKAEVVSLTEKLHGKEVAGEPVFSEKADDPQTVDVAHGMALQLNVKVEDRVSSGSGGSAVVDEDVPQLVDSGDSYFPNDDDYPAGCVSRPVDDGIQSAEEDDGSDDGRSYFSDVFIEPDHRHHEEGEALGWWVWS